MSIFVYGDESGVFDAAHHDVFVFGGLVFLNKEARDAEYRRFIAAERKLAPLYGATDRNFELKACRLKNKHKAGLFRSTNHCIRYAFVVDQRNVNENIFSSKKSKQRYLDYVYKVGLKRVFGRLIQAGKLKPSSVSGLFIRFDEHTTTTDGRYELREAIEQEFKFGTHNFKYNTFHPPLFPGMQGTVHLEFRDSKNDALIRASDIIANQMWYHEISGQFEKMEGKAIVVRFP